MGPGSRCHRWWSKRGSMAIAGSGQAGPRKREVLPSLLEKDRALTATQSYMKSKYTYAPVKSHATMGSCKTSPLMTDPAAASISAVNAPDGGIAALARAASGSVTEWSGDIRRLYVSADVSSGQISARSACKFSAELSAVATENIDASRTNLRGVRKEECVTRVNGGALSALTRSAMGVEGFTH
eukprot:scaffold9592_cov118-Isochrysis_galbana.AAC.2